MIKKAFGITLLAGFLGLATVAGLHQQDYKAARAADPIQTVDIFGTHNYFTGNAGDWGGNLAKDQVEGEITFSRLNHTATNDNCWISLEKGLNGAGTYIFTAKMRASADFDGDNIGFGFWAGSHARVNDTVVANQLAAGVWKNVEVRFEFTQAVADEIDSIHMWCLIPVGGYVDFYDLQLRDVKVGSLADNIIKDVGFENVDLSGGEFRGWNNRHSGNINGTAVCVWTSEGTGETYNQYASLRYTAAGDAQFADFCSLFGEWNGSWSLGIEAGEYLVELDVRKNSLVNSDNVGMAIYSTTVSPRIERSFTDQVTAAPVDEWTHISLRYPDQGVELTQAYADGVDSFQFWFNTGNVVGAQLDIDNLSVRRVYLDEDKRPEFQGGVYAFDWVEANNQDLVINVSDLHGYTDLKVLNGDYELLENEEFTFSANVLTIKKEFLAEFDDGVQEFKAVTTGGERGFTIEITHIQEDLPDVAGYTLEETVFGGDFMDLEVGYTMNNDQTEYAWGAVSNYDDGGVVVEEADGSHALQFKKPEGSTKSYSSSFVIYHPEKIVENTIVTMAFDYKYVGGASTDPGVDVCWVGNSNVSYHLIKLNGAKNVKTIEPQAKYRQWDVAYTDLANGYTHVEYSMRIDAATVTATNSIRFLMKYNGNADQALRIQNVSLKKWVKSLGSLAPESATFDKANPTDVSTVVTFADGLNLYAVAVDSKTNYVAESNYTTAVNGSAITLTLKKEFLATLANGDHTFYISSTETATHEYAELAFVVSVSGESQQGGGNQGGGETTPETPAKKKKGCGSSIAAVGGVLALISVAGITIVSLKKRKEK